MKQRVLAIMTAILVSGALSLPVWANTSMYQQGDTIIIRGKSSKNNSQQKTTSKKSHSSEMKGDTIIKGKNKKRPELESRTGGVNKTKYKVVITSSKSSSSSNSSSNSNKRRNRDRNQRILNDYAIIHDHSKTAHFSGFGIGFISMNNLGSLEIDKDMASSVQMSSSLKYDLSFFDAMYSLGPNNWSIVTGLGIEFNSIHFTSARYMDYQKDVAFVNTTEPGMIDNSRLHITYLVAPLLFEVNFGSHRTDFPFFFNFGALFKLKTASSSKVWWNSVDGNPAHREIISKNLGLKPVNFDLIAQFGKGNWGLFATYSPISPFQKDMGPNVGTFTTGIKLYFSQR